MVFFKPVNIFNVVLGSSKRKFFENVDIYSSFNRIPNKLNETEFFSILKWRIKSKWSLKTKKLHLVFSVSVGIAKAKLTICSVHWENKQRKTVNNLFCLFPKEKY